MEAEEVETWTTTHDLNDPCAYCVSWDDNNIPRRADGSVVTRLFGQSHPECAESVAAYQRENKERQREAKKPKKKASTPATKLSTDKMRAEGWHVEKVEQWIPGANVRRDLFGFGDLLCIGPEQPVRIDGGLAITQPRRIMLVQCTSHSGGNVSAHVQKIADSPLVGMVREAGIEIVVHGWHKVGKEWQCRVVDCS